MKSDPRQMVLDLFPEERPKRKSPLERMMDGLIACGCEEGRVRPLVEELFRKFGNVEGTSRARCLAYFYGTGRHAIPRLQACPPCLIGIFDEGIDYHAVWDRCWAAKWIPLQEVFEVAGWHYCQYKEPYTGAPVYVWYIDNEGREVKRPYEG